MHPVTDIVTENLRGSIERPLKITQVEKAWSLALPYLTQMHIHTWTLKINRYTHHVVWTITKGRTVAHELQENSLDSVSWTLVGLGASSELFSHQYIIMIAYHLFGKVVHGNVLTIRSEPWITKGWVRLGLKDWQGGWRLFEDAGFRWKLKCDLWGSLWLPESDYTIKMMNFVCRIICEMYKLYKEEHLQNIQ